MKIGVISDTHIPERAPKVPEEVLQAFKGVDLILHAGDLTNLEVLESLKHIAPVKAVSGNMDRGNSKESLKAKELITVGKYSVGLTHGGGNPKFILETVRNVFPEKPDVIVFGHSHIPLIEKKDGILFFNPGSPTDTVFSPYRSCGILEINDEIKATIVRLA